MLTTIRWLVCISLLMPVPVWAQSSDTTTETATPTAQTDADLLTTEELQTLVGPVALYPDTLLIQILVAATFPLEVVKADRFVTDNNGTDIDTLKPELEAQGWDESVTVLATAFPDVLADMAVHIDWTEAVGTAMLAQTDDVMNAVQDMRAIAEENGALATTDEQTVEVTQEEGDQTIIIQPSDPEVVYVPQYEPEVVYVEDNSSDGTDLLTAGLLTFGAFILIDEIFDDDDDWYGYWGCRNCGGWGGGPIIRNPDIDIDIDGDVNIGNRGDVDIGWRPEEDRRDDARDRISNHRDENGTTKLPVEKPDRGDELRNKLSGETGAGDISRPGAERDIATTKAKIDRPGGLSGDARQAVTDRTRQGGSAAAAIGAGAAAGGAAAAVANRPAAKPVTNKVAKKPSVAKAPVRKPTPTSAVSKRASAPKARSGGARGRSSAGGRRR